MRPALDQQVTFLYAENPEECWRFYEEVLELPLVQDQGSVRIYGIDGSRAFLGVCWARAPRAAENPRVVGGVIFTLVTQDVALAFAVVREITVQIKMILGEGGDDCDAGREGRGGFDPVKLRAGELEHDPCVGRDGCEIAEQ